ncbi:MAG: hydroxylamine reductase [Faecalibacterium sp.]
MDEQMFCFQCEQAAGCTACTGAAGVCGKSAETAAAQDRLTGALIAFAGQLIAAGRGPAPEQARLLMQGLFTTITNVNFDPAAVDALTRRVHDASPGTGPDYDMQALWREPDADRRSLKCFVLFSLRGMAAYNYHARVLGRIDQELDRFFCTALQAVGDPGQTTDALWQLVQATGEASYRCMELLDAANTGAFGDPEPVQVPLTIEKGPFIVISGHDLYDAQQLLEQTAGRGVNVYTHSEMLPAHGYPELKRRYPHLKGNFGTAWQNQQREFEDIPAPILFTTNCIMPLRASYADRVFTTSVVAYPGVPHIDEGRDFSPVIEKALELGGYAQDTLLPGLNGGSTVTTGFARLTPPDTILLTLACGKFRLNDLPLGTVPGTGLPRILDVGQCNDAYSAIRIALALADAFGCGVNDLPLSLVLCWFEQKAVCILIALLALGIRNIRLGPTLPPFLSPVIVAALQQKYDLKAVTTPENDLQAILGRH